MYRLSPQILLCLCLFLTPMPSTAEEPQPHTDPDTVKELPAPDLPADDEPRKEKAPGTYTPIEMWPELDLGLCDN